MLSKSIQLFHVTAVSSGAFCQEFGLVGMLGTAKRKMLSVFPCKILRVLCGLRSEAVLIRARAGWMRKKTLALSLQVVRVEGSPWRLRTANAHELRTKSGLSFCWPKENVFDIVELCNSCEDEPFLKYQKWTKLIRHFRSSSLSLHLPQWLVLHSG